MLQIALQYTLPRLQSMVVRDEVEVDFPLFCRIKHGETLTITHFCRFYFISNQLQILKNNLFVIYYFFLHFFSPK